MAEVVKRLVPKPDTLRVLYLLSGNVCAFPGCSTVMIDKDGTMIGEVCHIEAAEQGGPRFNAKMTNETRRRKENLYLLCPTHHRAVDAAPAKYPVAHLKKMKESHEAKFRELDETLKQKFQQQFSDHTDAIVPEYPTTLKSIQAGDFGVLTEKQLSVEVATFKAYIDRLRNVPDRERQFMLAILKRAQKLGNTRDAMYVHTDDINSALGISTTAIKRHAGTLERHSVGDLREYDDGQWVVEIFDPGKYIGWAQIVKFGEDKGISLEKFVIDVQLQLLD